MYSFKEVKMYATNNSNLWTCSQVHSWVSLLKDKQFNKTIINLLPQQPFILSCSKVPKFIDPHVLCYKEQTRHDFHFENKLNCSIIHINRVPKLFQPNIRQIQDVKMGIMVLVDTWCFPWPSSSARFTTSSLWSSSTLA